MRSCQDTVLPGSTAGALLSCEVLSDVASLAPSALTSLFRPTAKTSNTQERLVRALSLCEAESCCVSVAAFLDHLKKGFSGPLVLLHGSHDGSTGVQDAAAALAAAKEEDAAMLVLSRGNTRGSPCSSQLIETAGIRLSPPQIQTPSSSSEKIQQKQESHL